ncbi:RNA polymerase sigma factor [Coprococcus eutactus]|uniref:RNA polymerase sigma factor n=1 Tax=Coprococcus eutactus TaxID=33043 RepID=UPI001D09769B|nr:sigma-70 family RNA polymerase sigma factor [Coprococcus eutactus]MCB6629886.1 sigma-70 family RNA polymerase sigma factor [Coprococcus eutactus]MCG4791362.1 sigma-70 family RNA polymerase sigma factor [Coprococcus eutactus]MCQ5119790.1 sigma-70 family RNA polymerase sigma factor [Coprococcus eutactus]MCQ5133649.1 sigma-70 family RNA polymerase sigma factor [Coprococcus eutactus]MCQ5137109.1 sigma-70 family RNA polymerase sigma factor [Coprococcus eutactus]
MTDEYGKYDVRALVARVVSGDMKAFEVIYQNTYRQVYYTCMSFLKNEQNVYDVMQDTYITALTHLQQLENPERITAWLNTIAVNKCRQFLGKKMPVQLDEATSTNLLEENDNFLPESYVLNAEKRKIILNIMQEELSAVQYQTIIMYYFDGMSTSEIAACMECPEGTVSYRLSAARGKIKEGVQRYENTNGVKLYSSGTTALLTAVFLAETQGLVIPNFLTSVFSAVFGAAAGTVLGTATGGAAVGTLTGGAAAGGAATGVASAGVKTAGKLGLKGLFKTLKAKIVASVVAASVVAGGAAGIIIHNRDKDSESGGKNYREVNYVVCDNEYLTVTIDKVYDIGCGPEDETIASAEGYDISENDCALEYTVVNHKDYMVYYNIMLLTSNNESYEGGLPTNWGVQPNSTSKFYIVDSDGVTFFDLGRKPTVTAKMLFCTLEDTTGNAGPFRAVDSVIVDVDLDGKGEADSVNYTRNFHVDGEQVVTDNDQVKVTYLGTNVYDEIADKNYYSAWMNFYVENKTDHDLGVSVKGDNIVYDTPLRLMAGTTGYITHSMIDAGLDKDDNAIKNKEIVEGGEPFAVSVDVCDYTESYGGVTTYDIYVAEHGETAYRSISIDDYTNIYSGQFDMVKITRENVKEKTDSK